MRTQAFYLCIRYLLMMFDYNFLLSLQVKAIFSRVFHPSNTSLIHPSGSCSLLPAAGCVVQKGSSFCLLISIFWNLFCKKRAKKKIKVPDPVCTMWKKIHKPDVSPAGWCSHKTDSTSSAYKVLKTFSLSQFQVPSTPVKLTVPTLPCFC
jgi:hypothetical protein